MNIKKAASGLALLAASGVVCAQTAYVRPAYSYPVSPEGSGPTAIQMGSSPWYVTPWVGAAVGHDDNLFLSPSNERDSPLYIISPGVRFDARSANSVLQATLSGAIGRYTDSENDDYEDWSARASGDFAFDRRNFLRLGAEYLRGHDPRGSTDRPITLKPDKYKLSSVNGTYAFGAPGALGRAEVYGGYGSKRYLNNHVFTQASDRDTSELGGAFYWRVAPATYALVEGRYTRLDYKLSNSPQDSKEGRVYLGIVWEATAATTGTLKVGRLEKKFERTYDDFSGTSWEGLITWMPRTYSKFDFYAARMPTESTGLGSFILSDVFGASWTHGWSSTWSTGVDVRFQRDDYKGFDRSDDITTVGLKVGYKFRRWLTFGAEYNYSQRDSNLRQYEYDRNLYLLTATASM